MSKAIDLIYNKEEKKYYLVEIEYDLDTGHAQINPISELSDHIAGALYKIDTILGEKQKQIMKEKDSK